MHMSDIQFEVDSALADIAGGEPIDRALEIAFRGAFEDEPHDAWLLFLQLLERRLAPAAPTAPAAPPP